MNKQIKDYIHLYLGCGILTDTGGRLKLIAVQIEVIPCTNYRVIVLNGNVTHELTGEFKPILRELSDMSEEEIFDFGFGDLLNLSSKEYCIEKFKLKALLEGFTPDQVLWLLSNHFDIFGLIQAGLAINKTKINNP